MIKWLYAGSAVLAVGAVAAYTLWPQTSDARGLVIEQPVQDVGRRSLGETIVVTFPIKNSGVRALRIIGFSGG